MSIWAVVNKPFVNIKPLPLQIGNLPSRPYMGTADGGVDYVFLRPPSITQYFAQKCGICGFFKTAFWYFEKKKKKK